MAVRGTGSNSRRTGVPAHGDLVSDRRFTSFLASQHHNVSGLTGFRSPDDVVLRVTDGISRRLGDAKYADCLDLAVHHDTKTRVAVLEYASEGRVVSTGAPYTSRYVSVIAITDREVTHWRDYLDPWRSSTRSMAVNGRRKRSGASDFHLREC
jgi:hypothetical protein